MQHSISGHCTASLGRGANQAHHARWLANVFPFRLTILIYKRVITPSIPHSLRPWYRPKPWLSTQIHTTWVHTMFHTYRHIHATCLHTMFHRYIHTDRPPTKCVTHTHTDKPSEFTQCITHTHTHTWWSTMYHIYTCKQITRLHTICQTFAKTYNLDTHNVPLKKRTHTIQVHNVAHIGRHIHTHTWCFTSSTFNLILWRPDFLWYQFSPVVPSVARLHWGWELPPVVQ